MSEVAALGARIVAAASEAGKEGTKALTQSAKNVERGAKSRAPKDTGTLAGEIYSATRGGRTAQIIAPTRYAQFQEHGTSKMAPQPFMAPALEAESAAYLASVEDIGAAALAKAIGG
jgi:HK97 gp10 family phage protein